MERLNLKEYWENKVIEHRESFGIETSPEGRLRQRENYEIAMLRFKQHERRERMEEGSIRGFIHIK